MKPFSLFIFSAAIVGVTLAATAKAKSVNPPTSYAPSANQFTSTVQLAIHESNALLVRRAQKLAIQQFANTIDASPELRGRRYEVDTRGNEVAFVVSTDDDVRDPFQSVVLRMVGELNDRVRGSGKLSFYRTSLENPVGGFFKVVVDDKHSKIRSVSAQSVPLRHLLKELQAKLVGLSYLIPGECAERLVDWSFGEDEIENALAPTSKHVDVAMAEIATMFGLKNEKRNGTYIFTGSCADLPMRTLPGNLDRRVSLTPVSFTPGMRPSQVFLTFPPLGN